MTRAETSHFFEVCAAVLLFEAQFRLFVLAVELEVIFLP
jgi:hypothetical protein